MPSHTDCPFAAILPVIGKHTPMQMGSRAHRGPIKPNTIADTQNKALMFVLAVHRTIRTVCMLRKRLWMHKRMSVRIVHRLIKSITVRQTTRRKNRSWLDYRWIDRELQMQCFISVNITVALMIELYCTKKDSSVIWDLRNRWSPESFDVYKMVCGAHKQALAC